MTFLYYQDAKDRYMLLYRYRIYRGLEKDINIANFAINYSYLRIDMEEAYRLYKGRPIGEDCTEMENKVYNFLDSLNINYNTLKHPAAFTIEECQKVRDRVNAPVFKNLFLTNKQQTKFYLLVMPGEKIFKTKYLSSQINSSRLSFASDEMMNHYLGLSPGSVSPMGLINDSNQEVKLLLDEDLKQHEEFACHPCINSASLVMKLNDLIEKVIPATGHDINWVNLPWE